MISKSIVFSKIIDERSKMQSMSIFFLSLNIKLHKISTNVSFETAFASLAFFVSFFILVGKDITGFWQT